MLMMAMQRAREKNQKSKEGYVLNFLSLSLSLDSLWLEEGGWRRRNPCMEAKIKRAKRERKIAARVLN